MLNLLNTDKMHHLGEIEEIRKLMGVNGTTEMNILLLAGEGMAIFLLCLITLYLKRKVI